jgi:polyphosphate glucokinase
VRRAIAAFDDMLFFDRLFVGGGNAKQLSTADIGPKGEIVPNTSGILGGVRVWDLDA